MPRIIEEYSDYETYSRDELVKATRILAKRANTRLRSIEQENLQEGSHAYKAIERMAYDRLEFIDETESGQFKFKTAMNFRTRDEILAEMKELQYFLFQSKTSWVGGVLETYTKFYDTAVERGYTGSFEDFTSAARQSQWKRIADMYGSDTANEITEAFSPEVIDNVLLKHADLSGVDLYTFRRWLDEEVEFIQKHSQDSDRGLADLIPFI